MKNRTLLLLLFSFTTFNCIISQNAWCQSVAINTDGSTADATAILDVKSTVKGMLIPRMTTAQRTAIATPATGLFVFDTDTNAFWYYNGTGWTRIESTGTNWSITGNSGTTAGTNFMGTADAVDVVFKSNNTEHMRLLNTATQNAIATITGGDLQINGVTVGRGGGNINFNTATGNLALYSNTGGTGNTAMGYATLYSSTGSFNTAIGQIALYSNTTGGFNTAIGCASLFKNSTGTQNVVLGYQTMYTNTSGGYNAAIGGVSLYSNTSGGYNTAFGFSALYTNTTGGYNIANGPYAMFYNTAGSNNAANGYEALFNNTTGTGNTGDGDYALSANTTGNYNTGLGYQANVSTGSLTNATAVGYNTIANASNEVMIGNTSVTVIGGQVGWSTLSDGRFKTNIKEDVPGLDFIMQLRPVTYNFSAQKYADHLRQNMPDSLKRTARINSYSEAESLLHTGFIAQEVDQVVKKNGYRFSAVHTPTNATDNYSIVYDEFVVPLVKAVQEENKMISEQQKIISEQQQKMEALEKRLEKLEHQ